MTRSNAHFPGGVVSVFDAIRTEFDALGTGPDPLCVPGTQIPGLPDRPVPVTELKELLLTAGCAPDTRDAAWAVLVTRARQPGRAGRRWQQACLGMARPKLRKQTRHLTRFVDTQEVEDIASAVLAGFCEALATLDLRPGWIAQRLHQNGLIAARQTLRELRRRPRPDEAVTDDEATPLGTTVPGHPEDVLARAVADGVLSARQAELVAATRLQGRRLRDYASEHGRGYDACRRARSRAEAALRTYLTSPPEDPDASTPAGRRRARRRHDGNPRTTNSAGRCPKRGCSQSIQGCEHLSEPTQTSSSRESR